MRWEAHAFSVPVAAFCAMNFDRNSTYSAVQYCSIPERKFLKAGCLQQHAECVRSPELSIAAS
jgi:hypothetical protein